MTFQVRDRPPPVDTDKLFGEHAADLARCPKLKADIRDRAAYLYITGELPSHLQDRAKGILKQISRPYSRPTSFDGLHGSRLIHDDAVRHLGLHKHKMVIAVREKVKQGYKIELTRENSNRSGFGKIFMYKWQPYPTHRVKITVTASGAIGDGWDL
ncbi:hypothetical protein BXY66_0294 [Shimia isoporae]|uniref:Uncharacterized protein n=1 Tax=Shimia isoporae TaxID=647720 RepID=A0A4R1NKS3_9RHOB|nr:hypothetical protein [Shimia isoporae]TCL08259.1 hypothetical protein BXY66_0294 [Shimia isoporae]